MRYLIPRQKSLIIALLMVLAGLSTLFYTVGVSGQSNLSAIVNTSQLKMRSSPSLRAAVITTLPRNTTVTIDGRNRTGSWLHGNAPSGESGWMYRSYLKLPRGTRLLSLPIVGTVPTLTPAPTYAPVTVQAAFQPFEKGMMIWRGDTKSIYVLFNPGVYGGEGYVMQTSDDPRFKNNPIDPSQIPSGRYQPVSGFGRLWDNNPTVHNGLGWATAPESAYILTVHRHGPYPIRYVEESISLPDGRTIIMGGSMAIYWWYDK